MPGAANPSSPDFTRFTLLTGATIVGAGSPPQDLLLASGRIAAMAQSLSSRLPRDLVDVHELDGLTVAPGLVDAHIHFLGGGGGDGFDTRAPELALSDLTLAGITTAVGAPGIDMVSRSMEGLLAKARGLQAEGLTAGLYVGGFDRPLRTLSGPPWRDCYLLPDVVGLKIAVGEPRAPSISDVQLVDFARELAWVERATQRSAVLHIHLGLDPEGAALLKKALPRCPDARRVVVTHCNYSPENLEASIELAQLGARVDLTTMMSPERGVPGSIAASVVAAQLLDAGVEVDRISMSTDANGSVPEQVGGEWEPYRTNTESLLAEVRELAKSKPLDLALSLVTANPAAALKLSRKGKVAVGADADLLVLDGELRLLDVYAKGQRVVHRGRPAVLGRFEKKQQPPKAPDQSAGGDSS